MITSHRNLVFQTRSSRVIFDSLTLQPFSYRTVGNYLISLCLRFPINKHLVHSKYLNHLSLWVQRSLVSEG